MSAGDLGEHLRVEVKDFLIKEPVSGLGRDGHKYDGAQGTRVKKHKQQHSTMEERTMAKKLNLDETLNKLYEVYKAKAKADAQRKGKEVGEGFHSPYTRVKGVSFLEAVELLTGLPKERVQSIVAEKFHLLPAKGGRWIVSAQDFKSPQKKERIDRKQVLLELINEL
jgi:hypothetical protein